jgi:hypothetical protein
VVLYPNPASDMFRIHLSSETDGKVSFLIYDISGKLVMTHEGSVTTGGQWIHQQWIPDLAPGIYHCRLHFDGDSGAERVHNSRLVVLSH